MNDFRNIFKTSYIKTRQKSLWISRFTCKLFFLCLEVIYTSVFYEMHHAPENMSMKPYIIV